MYKKPQNKLTLTDERKRILRNTVIRQDSPGTILHDFDAAISFLRMKKQALTPAHQLSLSTVKAINQRLQHPVELALKRAVQKSYPPVHGLYLLLRASGLTYVDSSGKQPTLCVDETAYDQWIKLSETEQYFSLLEAWLLRGYGEILGESPRFLWDAPDGLECTLRFVERYDLEQGLVIAGKRNLYQELKYTLELHNLGILQLLGIIHIEVGTPQLDEWWNIERITLTPFGGALLSALYTELSIEIHRLLRAQADEELEEVGFQSIFQPYFPEWKHTFAPPEPTFVSGTHTFKVTVFEAWRRIAIGAQETLDTLARAILDSVQFDDDHLYDFQYRNRIGKQERISHPYNQDPPLTSEVRVGELGLEIGQHMTFLFDYGDNWEFDVVLEAIEPDSQLHGAEIRAEFGEAPVQYPNEDDDEWVIFLDVDDILDFDGEDIEDDE